MAVMNQITSFNPGIMELGEYLFISLLSGIGNLNIIHLIHTHINVYLQTDIANNKCTDYVKTIVKNTE